MFDVQLCTGRTFCHLTVCIDVLHFCWKSPNDKSLKLEAVYVLCRMRNDSMHTQCVDIIHRRFLRCSCHYCCCCCWPTWNERIENVQDEVEKTRLMAMTITTAKTTTISKDGESTKDTWMYSLLRAADRKHRTVITSITHKLSRHIHKMHVRWLDVKVPGRLMTVAKWMAISLSVRIKCNWCLPFTKVF